MFSALAEGHGNLQDKISHFIALAPAVNFKFQQVPDKEGLAQVRDLLLYANQELALYDTYIPKYIQDLMVKYHPLENIQNPISARQALHFIQLELSGKF